MTALLVLVAVAVIGGRHRRRVVLRRSKEIRRSLPEVIDVIVAALRAGHTPAGAMAFVVTTAPTVVRATFVTIADGLARGERFSVLLQTMVHELGSVYGPLADILIAGERLGIPTESLIVQLNADARFTRRSVADADARRLPVRLGLPLVCCTLPSFVVLVIVPVVAGTLSHVHISE